MRRTKSHENLQRGSLLTEQSQLIRSQISSSNDDQFEMTPLEGLIRRVDGAGKYQLCSFIFLSFMWFFTAWVLVGQAFFFDNWFTCKDEPDQNRCKKLVCGLQPSEWTQQIDQHANSLVFAFDGKWMICQYEYYRPILTSLTYLGSLIGFFIIPHIADNWGRKPALRISWSFFVLGALCLCLCDSPNMTGLGFFFSGFGSNPAVTLSYSLINEQCIGRRRQYYLVAVQILFAVGECVIGLLFLPGYSWRYVFYLMFGCVLMLLFFSNYVLESPKFLISKSKKKTLDVLNKIATINKRKPLLLEDVEKIQVFEEADQGISVIDLFRYGSLRWIAIGGGISLMSIQIIYYCTSLNLDKAGYDMLTNQQIIGVSEGIGYLIAEIMISKVRRKKISLIGLGLTIVLSGSLGVMTMMENDSNRDALLIGETIGLLINRLILCCFGIIFYVFISQLLPTRARNLGVGWVMGMGTVGSTLSPYILFFSQKIGINSWFPPAVIGILGMLSIICLKQTFGKPMRQEIRQIEQRQTSPKKKKEKKEGQ